MPHADSSFVPADITTKSEFYAHVEESLKHLLEGERYWVTNLAQTASLLYHSYLASHLYGGTSQHPVVNWTGFYLHPPSHSSHSPSQTSPKPLILGPYHGRPACLSITPNKGKGVCADTFVSESTIVVQNVEEYPGHIACDGETKAEIVLPLYSTQAQAGTEEKRVIGVLDLDSTQIGTFDKADQEGLERIVSLLAKMTDFI